MSFARDYIISNLRNLIDKETITSLYSEIKSSNNTDLYRILQTNVPLVVNEDIPLNKILEETEINKSLLDEYEKSNIHFKEKKLIEHYNIRVYHGDYNRNVISYKNIDNINDNIKLLFTDDLSNIKTFIDNLIGTENIDYASEFLFINDNIPNMFKTDRIKYYSALLNFNPSDLENDVVKSFLALSDIDKNNWIELSYSFKKFLEKLLERTIHY